MITISEKFKICGDDNLNFELYELKPVISKKTKQTRIDWEFVGYYGKFEHALKAALNKYLLSVASSDEAVTLKALAENIDKAISDLKNIRVVGVTPHPEEITND